MALKNIPQAERLLSGTLTSYLSDVATTCVMSDPPSKFPTYIDLEPDSTTKKELVRAVAVSGSTVTIERSVNGVTTDHAANATYKQKLTSRHWDAVSDALESGYLMEDALRVLIRVSDTQFTITGYGASDDLTGVYTTGRVLRINSSASYVMTVTSSSYNAGTNKTTVNVSATLPTPVSTVEFGVAPEGGTDLPLVSKTLTTPVINTGFSGTAKATSAEVATGTDDAKIVTPKALKDAGIIALTKAAGSDITTGTDDAKFVTSLAVAGYTTGIDGWIPARETWAYASASTITVPSGAAAKYSIGDSIRWKQGGAYKYGVIKTVADTLLTIIVNTDHTVADAAITDNYYTHLPTAIGLPAYYNLTPSWSNITLGAGANVGKYKTTGRWMELYASWTFGAGAAVSIDAKLNYPVTPSIVGANFGDVSYVDASATNVYGFLRNDGYLKYYIVSGTLIGQGYLQATSPFTWTTNDAIVVEAGFHF